MLYYYLQIPELRSSNSQPQTVTMPATVFVHQHLPVELQVMPVVLRILERIGFWGSWKPFYRFVILLCFNTAVILAPKVIFGIGTDHYHLIAKGISEFLFVFIGVTVTPIFASQRSTFEQVVYGLRDIFYKVTAGNRCHESYAMITNLNKKLDLFTKFIIFYCKYGAISFCMKSVAISHWRYWKAIANNSTDPVIFELPAEQE